MPGPVAQVQSPDVGAREHAAGVPLVRTDTEIEPTAENLRLQLAGIARVTVAVVVVGIVSVGVVVVWVGVGAGGSTRIGGQSRSRPGSKKLKPAGAELVGAKEDNAGRPLLCIDAEDMVYKGGQQRGAVGAGGKLGRTEVGSVEETLKHIERMVPGDSKPGGLPNRPKRCLEVRHVQYLLEAVSNVDDAIRVSEGEAFVSGSGNADVGTAEQFQRQACGGRIMNLEPPPSCDVATEADFLHVVAGKGNNGSAGDGGPGGEPKLTRVADRTPQETGRVEDADAVVLAGGDRDRSGR